MKTKFTLRQFLLLAGSLLAISSAHAQSGNWNVDAAGNWSLDTNWNPVAVPGTAAADVIGLSNDITGARIVTIDTTSRTAGLLNIGDSNNSHAFTLAAGGGAKLTFNNSSGGASLTESGSVADVVSTPITLADNLAVSVAGALTMSGIIDEIGGAKSIAKSGAGNLTLSGNNSYSGGFTLNLGQVIIPVSGTYTGFGTGTLTINGGQIGLPNPGAAFAFTTANDSVWNANFNVYRGQTSVATWNHGGDITLGANVTVNSLNNGWTTVVGGVIDGTGSLTLAGNTLTFTLNSANTYSGGTTTGTGILNINNSGSGGTSSAIGTGALNLSGGAINNTSGSAVTLSTNNAVNISSNFTFTGSNDLNLGTGAIYLNGNRQITVSAGKLTMGGTLTAAGAQGWNKLGGGTLTLTASNSTNTGRNTISAGVVEVSTMSNYSANSSLGAQPNADGLWIAGGSTLRYIGSADVTTNRGFTLSSSGGSAIESSGLGALSFGTPTNALAYGTASQPRGLVLGGTNAGDNTFEKILGDNGGGTTPLSVAFLGGDNSVTLASVTGVSSGAAISGTGIAPGTTVSAIDVSTRVVTLSAPTTGAGVINQVMTVTGVVNTSSLTKSGAGKWIISAANTYTGVTTVSDGTLKLGANNVLTDTSNVTIGTGTLDADTRTDTAGTLNAAGAAVIKLGSGAALAFANSSGVNGGVWDGALNITGIFVSGNDIDPTSGVNPGSIRFGVNNTGLTASQLADITVNGSGTYTLDAFGFLKAGGGGASPYDSWAASKGLTGGPGSSTDPAKGADPDKDGRNNLAEFAFNGNPLSGSDNGKVFVLTEDSDSDGDAIKELILTVAVRTGTPAFAGSPSPSASHDGITYNIDGSLTLASFATTVNVVPTPVVPGLPAAGVGYEYRSFSLSGSNGLAGKGFLRAKVTSP